MRRIEACEEMVTLCKRCHGGKLARKVLDEADAFWKQGAYMLEAAPLLLVMMHGVLDFLVAVHHIRVRHFHFKESGRLDRAVRSFAQSIQVG